MIDAGKLDALEHQLRNRHFDGLAPELIEVIGLARIVLAAQAAPSAVHAALAAFDAGPKDSQRIEECMEAALLAASLHRPVEARVTEEMVEAAIRKDRELSSGDPQYTPPMEDYMRMVLEAALALPSPQVTREELARIVCDYATGPSDANSCCPAPDGHKRCQRKADRILALFDGKAKP